LRKIHEDISTLIKKNPLKIARIYKKIYHKITRKTSEICIEKIQNKKPM